MEILKFLGIPKPQFGPNFRQIQNDIRRKILKHMYSAFFFKWSVTARGWSLNMFGVDFNLERVWGQKYRPCLKNS